MKRYATSLPDVIVRALSTYGETVGLPIEAVMERLIMQALAGRVIVLTESESPPRFCGAPVEEDTIGWPAVAVPATEGEANELMGAPVYLYDGEEPGMDAILAMGLERRCKDIMLRNPKRYSGLWGKVALLPGDTGFVVATKEAEGPTITAAVRELGLELMADIEATPEDAQ